MKHKLTLWCAGFIFSLCSAAAMATSVRVLALFPGKALVEIDGKRQLLRNGETVSGIRLLSAESVRAEFEIDGQRKSLKVGENTSYSKARVNDRGAEARIARSPDGHYRTTGMINGRAVELMVDTGATIVAMSAREAKRLGIQYRLDGKREKVNTAGGLAAGYSIKLDRVSIGGVAVSNVDGFVVDGNTPATVLLGMSYLNSVAMEYQSNLLILKKKY